MDQLASKTLADVYMKQGHFHEAYEILKSLSEKYPSDVGVRMKLEEAKEKLGLPFFQLRAPASPPGEKIQVLEQWLSNIRKREKTQGDATHRARLNSARKLLDAQSLDGLLFSSLENIRYLCGFTGSDGALLLSRKDCFFLTDSRYWTQADEEIKGSQTIHYKKKIDGIASLLSDLRLRSVGFESSVLPLSSHRALKENLAADVILVPLENELKNLRAIKDAQELDLIKKAIDISSRAFQHVLGMTREGMVEKDLALKMEFFMKRNGAEVLGFDIIVASGKRSALPHGKASEKRIAKGDLVLFDYGIRYQGYHSDETCTAICGEPSPEQQRIYQVVREAHDKAIEMVRPGIPVRDVDAAARDHIRVCGYGDYFGHGLGHGVGLNVHEDPFINADNKDILQEGMVFTVEPGIYIPEQGGVRLEDMVRVTAHGAEVLTPLSKDLHVIKA
jgi:Xaa-Pro aminopeptidase